MIVIAGAGGGGGGSYPGIWRTNGGGVTTDQPAGPYAGAGRWSMVLSRSNWRWMLRQIVDLVEVVINTGESSQS